MPLQAVRLLIVPVAMLVVTCACPAQTGIPSVVQGIHGEAIGLGGDIGTYGEVYSISGRAGRRPPASARIYFRPTLSLYDAMTLSGNVLLSTEGNAGTVGHEVNRINQFGITPHWSWGYASAGDFAETYTPWTLNGILVRGGGVTINPGLFRFSAIGGFTRRTDGGGFDRYLYGGRIGLGREGGSHVDLLAMRVRDIPSEFRIVHPDSLPVPDSTQIGTITNPYQETPQENLVLGLAGTLLLFDNALTVDAEGSGSAFTRDMTSTALDNDRIPSFIRGIYNPRLSSSADYAMRVGMNVDLAVVRLRTGFKRIGPGYNALGVASLITDVREFMGGADVRLSRLSGSVTWTRQNDNLLGQKLHTTVRQTLMVHLASRPLDVWSPTVFFNILTLRNYAGSVTDLIRFSTLGIGTSQTIMFGMNDFIRMAALSYMFQQSVDDNPLHTNSGSQSHMLTANASAIITPELSIVPSVSVVSSRIGAAGRSTIHSYSVTAQYRVLENRLTTSLTTGLSAAESSTSLQLNLNARYHLASATTVSLSLRRTGFSSTLPSTGDYSEYVGSVMVTQGL